MKRIITLITVALLSFNLSAKMLNIKTTIMQDGRESEFYEDSIVKVTLSLSYDRYFLITRVKNKTDGRIYIEWQNAKLLGANVLFKNDTPLTVNNAKPDEMIMAKDYARKEISTSAYYGSYSMELSPLVRERDIRNNKVICMSMVLPIRYGEKFDDISITVKFTLEE